MLNKDRYHVAIDGMRIIAILAVICIHSTTRIVEASSFNVQGFNLALFLNQVSRFAVPLFFMISGFVLEVNYPFHLSYVSYLKKRLSRIFLPYLFWSAIYYVFVYTHHTTSYFQTIVDGNASYHLYFIPTLLVFYLIFPFIHTTYRFISQRGILVGLGIIQVILLSVDYYIHPLPFYYPLTIALLNYYIFILGMVAAHHHTFLSQFVSRRKLVFTFFLCLFALFIYIEGKTLYSTSHNYLFFYSQWRPSVMLYSLLFFSVMYVLLNGLRKHEVLIRTISRLTFFVFFIHVIILEILWILFGRNLFQYSSQFPGQQVWYDPLFFISIVVVSYAIAFAAAKIPYLTKLTG